MIDHLGLQVRDADAAAGFYLDVFAALGLRQVMRFEQADSVAVGLAGPDGNPQFWLSTMVDDGHRPVHLALSATSRSAIDTVYDVALKRGTEILHAPREWPEYHPGYYAVFLRDLDGNNVEAVFHG